VKLQIVGFFVVFPVVLVDMFIPIKQEHSVLEMTFSAAATHTPVKP
jgi:hypothetical protein